MMYMQKLFCTKCGEPLSNSFVFHMYDDETGNPLYHVLSKCQNKKWYNFHNKFFRMLVSKDNFGRPIEFYMLINKEGEIVNG